MNAGSSSSPTGKWVKLSCSWLSRMAADERAGLVARVEYVALSRCGNDGHAPLMAGELAAILGTSSSSVSRAIRVAKQRGLLHKSSNARCLVVIPQEAVQNLVNGSRCTEHPSLN